MYLTVMAMIGYSTLSRPTEMEPHHQILLSIITRTPLFREVLPLCKGYSEYILSPFNKVANNMCSRSAGKKKRILILNFKAGISSIAIFPINFNSTVFSADVFTHPKNGECPGYNAKLHLIMRSRLFRSRESGIPSHCHYFHIHSSSEG